LCLVCGARALFRFLSSPVFCDAPVRAFGLLGLGTIRLASLRRTASAFPEFFAKDNAVIRCGSD
jgi:hypothetical protein